MRKPAKNDQKSVKHRNTNRAKLQTIFYKLSNFSQIFLCIKASSFSYNNLILRNFIFFEVRVEIGVVFLLY